MHMQGLSRATAKKWLAKVDAWIDGDLLAHLAAMSCSEAHLLLLSGLCKFSVMMGVHELLVANGNTGAVRQLCLREPRILTAVVQPNVGVGDYVVETAVVAYINDVEFPVRVAAFTGEPDLARDAALRAAGWESVTFPEETLVVNVAACVVAVFREFSIAGYEAVSAQRTVEA